MTTQPRPKDVIVLDKDNPLVEVIGEFYWLEDHCALMAAARAESYQQGYEAGCLAARCDAARPTAWPAGYHLRRAARFVKTVVVRVAVVILLLMVLGLLLAALD